MKGLGFGLERIGIVALAHPKVFLLLLILITAVSAVFIPSVRFDGNVTAVIPRTSQNFLNYERHKADFRNFSRDIAVIVRSPRLKTASGLEDLRGFQLDMSLADGVTSAVSIFSLPAFNSQTGQLETYFPSLIEDDSEATRLLARLVEDYPQVGTLISTETNAAMLLVALDLDFEGNGDEPAIKAFNAMVAEAEDLAPEDFELLYAGLTPISITILDTLIKDQVRLTLLGLLLGALVALLFFRCIASALLCAVPPMLTAIWSIGFFGLFEIPITYLTTILPTLALILAYADGIVLHHRWQQLNRAHPSAKVKNLREAVLRVGPASALTSITTALAIFSFSLSSSEALTEFAWIGVVLVVFAFLSVILALPMAGLWVARFDLLRSIDKTKGGFSVSDLFLKFFHVNPFVISALSILLLIPLLAAHFQLQPNYRVTDYLPRQSKTLEAERIANEVFGGRSLVFFSIPVAEEGGASSRKNRERLAEVSELLASEFGEASMFSLHAFWRDFNEAQKELIAKRLEEAGPIMRQGYLSKSGTRMLASLRISSSQSISQNSILLDELEETLAPLDYADEIIITGFPVLLAHEFTDITNELRTSLLIAVAIGICLIGLATRSVFYTLAVAVPNAFPILLVELFIYLGSGEISITQVVALTLAFGIAIDNAVHVVNIVEAERGSGKGLSTALRRAIVEVGPALAASTLIICAATLVTLTSILPILPVIGKLIIVILLIALITNLIILPANIISLGRLFGRDR